MLMPLLVRLNDSQVQLADGVVAELADGIGDCGGVSHQARAARLTTDQEVPLPDLHVDPVDRVLQPGCQLYGAVQMGVMCPPVSLRNYPDPGVEANAVHRGRQDLIGTVRG